MVSEVGFFVVLYLVVILFFLYLVFVLFVLFLIIWFIDDSVGLDFFWDVKLWLLLFFWFINLELDFVSGGMYIGIFGWGCYL